MKSKTASPRKPSRGAERRRSERRPVLETFALSVVVPGKGGHRLTVHDLSAHGLSFDFDLEGEDTEAAPLKSGERVDLRLYLNQSLYLPLAVKVARIRARKGVREIGAEFLRKESEGYQAFASFLAMIDEIHAGAGIDHGAA